MALQGEIRVAFMQRGVDQATAGDLASAALHLFAVSEACRPEVSRDYGDFAHLTPDGPG
jgi:hypothetical protein